MNHATMTLGNMSLLTTCAVALASCLYEPVESGIESPMLKSWDQAYVELVRESTLCDSAGPEGAVAVVGDSIEFPPDKVADMKPGCPNASAFALRIDVNSHSIVYDFSAVERPGSFGRGDFNGYVVTSLGPTHELAEVEIDREATTLPLDPHDVEFGSHTVAINLAGRSFDTTTLVKLDLTFADEEEEPDSP